jgi:hypothetical protein
MDLHTSERILVQMIRQILVSKNFELMREGRQTYNNQAFYAG